MAVSYETLMEKIPSQTVIDAVENASNGRVIASGEEKYSRNCLALLLNYTSQSKIC
jgi:hypothetical protein